MVYTVIWSIHTKKVQEHELIGVYSSFENAKNACENYSKLNSYSSIDWDDDCLGLSEDGVYSIYFVKIDTPL